MAEWCAPEHEPLVLVEGKGALLWDSEGREYIDGNSSIWTNIHGHNHPHINAAIRRQLDLVAHTSFLGFTNPAAIDLAEAIVGRLPDSLNRVFFSDDGSTGIEVALRIAEQYWRLKGTPRTEFVAFRGGYHGDTAGAASLGAHSMFSGPASWQFPARQVSSIDELNSTPTDQGGQTVAVVIEPIVQGAAGMRIWPTGTLRSVRGWCDRTGALLITDEVLTGFGRTGRMFACEHEGVIPDICVLGKALTAGYLPLAITAITDQLFQPFRTGGSPERTLFYGHSYTGNALGCAAALASLEIFDSEDVLAALAEKIEMLSSELASLRRLSAVADVRQCGFIAAVEVDPSPAFATSLVSGNVGAAVCQAARRYGLLTRPIRDSVVLMPPYCITPAQLKHAVEAIRRAILEVCEAALPAADVVHG